ncbi:glycosyltransferase [Lewinella sp. IMCC34191]|uniref:glycosyltransferase n=1 Tax=Lewinella sp. IMCC34191 TaxID=2259172 RepID=UPI000E27C7A2|nr:glycosyltransferase [Lewinella sp. IMCC34191]
MPRIKVLHIIKGLGRGGAETLLPETLRVHDREQFDFQYLYFLPHKDQVAKDLTAMGSHVDCVPATTFPGMLTCLPAVRRIVNQSEIDLIHCHLPLSGVIGRLVSKLTGVPVVYTEHNIQERYNVISRTLNLRTLSVNQQVICCSQDVHDSLDRYAPEHYRPNIVTVENGVNTERFSPDYGEQRAMRAQLGLPVDKKIIGTVCVFRDQKNLLLWVAAAAKLSAGVPDLHFVLVGNGPQEEAVRTAIRKAGMEDKFTLPGRLQEVRPWLRSLDVYLMTSKFEGLPIALLEAMSMQLPVVSSGVGGIPEAIRHGQEGYLVTEAIDRPEGYVENLHKILTDESLRDKLAIGARTRVQRSFSVQYMAGRLENVYRAAVKSNKPKLRLLEPKYRTL